MLPLFWHSVVTFSRCPQLSGIIIAFPGEELSHCQDMTRELLDKHPVMLPVHTVGGGTLRQDSVHNALLELPVSCTHVIVHDAARPFFTASLITRLISALEHDTKGVIPAISCKDTIKEINHGFVQKTLDRDTLGMIQTPQFFCKLSLVTSHELARKHKFTVTDDASMLEKSGYKVKVIPGLESNIKITTYEDLKMLETTPITQDIITGFGYDVHRYGGDRPMVLGGIPIPGGPRIHAHSDGDVLIHALIDAILSCMAKGDIGDLFPDTDPAYEGMSSTVFLAETLLLAQQNDLKLHHIDITIIAQVPKISPHKALIKSTLCGLTGLGSDQINIKATTEEHLGFTGAKQGIKVVALVTAIKNTSNR